MNEYKINILTFSLLNEKVNIFFSSTEKEGYVRTYKNNLPINISSKIKQEIEKYAWWSLTQGQGDETITVDLIKNSRFSNYYFNKIIYQHFEELGLPININFIKGIEVYVEDNSNDEPLTRKFNQYTLRFVHNTLVLGNSLLVTYDGETCVHKKDLSTLKLDERILGRVLFKGKILKFKELSETDKQELNQVFPVLKDQIRKSLNMPIYRRYSQNKYSDYFEKINSFYDNFLHETIIGNSIKIHGSGFYKPHNNTIHHTSKDSNLLLFGKNEKNFTPYIGIKENGPLHGPNKEKTINFFFIFNKDDRDYANKLFSYLKKGFKSFPGLESFVDLDFEIDQSKTIRFSKRNPIQEIDDALENMHFDNEKKYACIYISQIKKGEEDEEEDKIYYKVKERLLQYGITSQVVFRDNISNPAFNFFLPNIAIALLAKLGGIPWRLYRPIQNDLIIGVGACWVPKEQNRYIGSAFCFTNDGSFKGFNVFEKHDTTALSQAIKKAIDEYSLENISCDRLVIHYYKVLSKEEEKPITNMLHELNLNIPFVVLAINETESKDYVFFDTSFDGKMPQSGTYIKINHNEYLLCNNTRYSQSTKTRIDGFPFPIKIRLMPSISVDVTDMDVVKDLIDQVYQFSRMYYKSVRQCNLPVTIEYSKLIASMVANFEDKNLVPFAKNTLWFL